MAANPQLPRPQSVLIDSRDWPNSEWYTFWQQLLQFVQENGGTAEQIAEIEARLAALENGGTGIVKGEQSIFTTGALPNVVTVTLVNDDATPGNTYYYGTGPTGTKGWFAVSDAVAGADSVVQTVGPDGVSTFNLDGDDPAPDPLSSYATDLIGNKGWFRPALFESTGLLAWDAPYLEINGSDPTTFDVGAAIVGYTDYDTNPVAPTRAYAVYGPTTGNPVPNLANIATWVGIQTPGGTLVTQSSAFTPTQRRTIVQLGAVISNGTQLIAVNDLPVVMRAGINQIGDFMRAVGPINSGNLISANGANLNINKGSGSLFKEGANFVNNPDDPHNLPLAALTAATFAYRTSTSVQAANTTTINVTQYESSPGVLSTVGNNNFTVQRVYVFTSNLIRIQYGQTEYATMAAAEAAIATQPFNTEPNIAENGVLLCFLIVEKSATDLSDTAQAKFIPASKFGGPVGSGGTSITNTDALPEGVVNLYFTDERAQDAVGNNLLDTATVNLTYNDATGQISADVIPGGLSGSFQPLDADLTAIAALAGTGFPTRTAANTWAQRSFANGTGYTWTNPAGVAGDPTLVLNANLQAWSGIAPSTKADLAGGQTFTGNNTFTGALHTVGNPAGGTITTFDRPGSSAAGGQIQYTSPAGVPGIVIFTSTTSRIDLRGMLNLFQIGVSATSASPTVFFNFTNTFGRPSNDNLIQWGGASNRFSEFFAGNGVINTSDAREKDEVVPFTSEELAAARAMAVGIGTYHWLQSLADKGYDARTHIGLTVQRAIEIMQAHGLDPFRYGFICYDQWAAQPETWHEWPDRYDEDGNLVLAAGRELVHEYRAAGDRYSFRHDQLLLFIARGQEERIARLEALLNP